ncbi:MAG: globin [Nitrospirota bacterium]|nr:globin [Nitrospirota bacterium]MDE3242107.1 globin [Nitrospirota bacterium]
MASVATSVVKDSFSRCCVNPKFLDRFYEIFLASHPAIAPMFRNTDFARQKQLLRTGLTMVLMHGDGNQVGTQGLGRIGQSHSRKGMKIDPALYPHWVESLIKAVKECDPQCDKALEEEWRATLKKGTAFIASQY